MSDTAFETYRPLLFSIAYRMLGTVMDAEDIVQEAYLRWQRVQPETIESPPAFLNTVVTRLCLNRLSAARAEREIYIGPWLPEPLLTDEDSMPAQKLSKTESISMAFLVLLESLTPTERAVFILREVFNYDYQEIATMLDKSQVACRKLFSRAKQHIDAHRPRFDIDPQVHETLLANFIQATQTGDLESITRVLAEDAVLWTDGGGKTTAALHPIRGAENVAKFVLGSRKFMPPGAQSLEFANINGKTCALLMADANVVIVIDVEIKDRKIQVIHIVGNPEKLRHLRNG